MLALEEHNVGVFRTGIVLLFAAVAASSFADIATYRFEGTLFTFQDPVYYGQPPVTDGSLAAGQRFFGTFQTNTEAFYPLSVTSLTIGSYVFESSYSSSGRAPNAATIEGYNVTCSKIARPIPMDEYNRIETELVMPSSKLDAIFAAKKTSVSGDDLRGSQILLQLLWRNPQDNPQALQTRGSIDKVESVPEPASLAAFGLGSLVVLRRRKRS